MYLGKSRFSKIWVVGHWEEAAVVRQPEPDTADQHWASILPLFLACRACKVNATFPRHIHSQNSGCKSNSTNENVHMKFWTPKWVRDPPPPLAFSPVRSWSRAKCNASRGEVVSVWQQGRTLLTSGLQLWWDVWHQLSSPDPHYPALFHEHLISTKLLSACNTCVVPGSCIEIWYTSNDNK